MLSIFITLALWAAWAVSHTRGRRGTGHTALVCAAMLGTLFCIGGLVCRAGSDMAYADYLTARDRSVTGEERDRINHSIYDAREHYTSWWVGAFYNPRLAESRPLGNWKGGGR